MRLYAILFLLVPLPAQDLSEADLRYLEMTPAERFVESPTDTHGHELSEWLLKLPKGWRDREIDALVGKMLPDGQAIVGVRFWRYTGGSLFHEAGGTFGDTTSYLGYKSKCRLQIRIDNTGAVSP